MDNQRARIEARVQRERAAWSSKDIIKAQAFKYRIHAAFDNTHSRKLEAIRTAEIAARCRDAVVLDYGCYEGGETRRYLAAGAKRVIGIDISDKAIEKARSTISDPRAEFYVVDAHFLPFGNEMFDLVVGRAILHHLDLDVAFREIARILKIGGVATFVEPLFGNPVARIIRKLTPQARTPDERPLGKSDIELGNRIIGEGYHQCTGFVSVPLGVLAALLSARKDGFIMNVAAWGDSAVNFTPLRYWGRMVFMNFRKTSATAARR